MSDEKITPENGASGERFPIRAKKWLDNYFYHYKWHTIFGCFVLFVLIWCVASACSQVGTDMFLGYVGSYTYSPDEKEEIGDALSSAFDADVNGDGKTVISFNAISYFSEAEAEARFSAAKEKGKTFQLSAKGNAQNYETFRKQFEAGDVAVWLVSADVYRDLDRSMLLPLSELYETLPAEASDDYSVIVDKLSFKRKFLRDLPDGTRLVIRRKYNTGLRTDETETEEYLANCAFFRALISYR